MVGVPGAYVVLPLLSRFLGGADLCALRKFPGLLLGLPIIVVPWIGLQVIGVGFQEKLSESSMTNI